MVASTIRLVSGSARPSFCPDQSFALDDAPARVVGRFHFPPMRGIAPYRVVAELEDGRRRVVCVGMTPREARAHARANRDAIPFATMALVVEKWEGTQKVGKWVVLPPVA